MPRITANVYYTVAGKIYSASETPKAIRMRVESIDGFEIKPASMQWFPKSQFSELEHGVEGDQGEADEPDTIQATEWILEQKGMLRELNQVKVSREHQSDLGDADLDDLPDFENDIPF